MYADRVEIPEGNGADQYAVSCPHEQCPLRTRRGPWTYYITRELGDVPGHGEARHADAEKAWEAHVAEHHRDHKPQHRARPRPTDTLVS